MLQKWRHWEISLAAKCQLLFGAAVILIIAAALFVPWQRMEQLTDQINERSARALAESAKAQHLYWANHPNRDNLPIPSRIPGTPTTLPVHEDGRSIAVPKFLALWQPHELTSFEKRALDHLRKYPEAETYVRDYQAKDGTPSLRFALALRAEANCLLCHAHQAKPLAATQTTPTTTATTLPTILPPTLIGLATLDMPSQVDSNQQLLNRTFLLTAGLLAGTLAILVFFFITTKVILRPVRILRETAEKVSHGDLNVRSHISTGDEFQQLSETFNVMLANLKESEDQLRSINKSLDLKLGQLAESNVALYESNRLKSEFLANVSHELRTPLNSILGFAELLRETTGGVTDGRPGRYIANILQSGKNLLELINDLLDLAKIEAGRMEIRSAPLSLPDLFEGLTGILKPLSEKKSLTIETAVAPDVPILQTDAAKLQQVLYNFLSNAIKFSPQNGRIEVRADRAEPGHENGNTDHVKISVTDQGPGIEPEKQQLIFEKFRQIDGSVTREHGGTGLGLAISKELTTLMNGSIGVKSKPGEGSTFWIILPVRIDASARDVRAGLVLT